MVQVTTIDEVVAKVPDGAHVMLGGFLGLGSPLEAINALVRKGVTDLTLINPVGCLPGGDFDLELLINNHQVKKFITTHIGTSRGIIEQMRSGELEVELYPLGTFAEKVRAAGAGLGGVLTPTGLGTWVEDGKKVVEVEGKKYLLELPLRADFAFVKAWRADTVGNVQYRLAGQNLNHIIATAADFTCVEASEIVPAGQIDPAQVHTQGIYVDAIVQSESVTQRNQIFNEAWHANGVF